jgi:hypothetical protein
LLFLLHNGSVGVKSLKMREIALFRSPMLLRQAFGPGQNKGGDGYA